MVLKPHSNILRTFRPSAKVAQTVGRSCQHICPYLMPTMLDPQIFSRAGNTTNMPYTHCNTRIVSLVDLDIPEMATEHEYKKLYNRISKSQAPAAQALTDAVGSVSLGIAPPVAFPTETVYGLGADATNKASIAGIFAAKGRPSDNPLIVHIASREHLERLTGQPLPAVYADLVREHWPGPLTILVPIPTDDSIFAPNVHPGQRTIGFRVPESKYARFFIAATGKPIAGPSANSSGKPSPTTAQHVMDDLKGKINFILDGGSCDVGVESTVVDGLHDPPLILRPGGLSQDDLIAHGKRHGNVWAHVGIGEIEADEAPRAPGMKYKHYAPRGQMILFEGPNSVSAVNHELDTITVKDPKPLNVAVLTSTSWPTNPADLFHPVSTTINTNGSVTYKDGVTLHVINLGTSPAEIAKNLFAALRECDDRGCGWILAEAPRVGIDGIGDEGVPVGRRYEFDAVLERMRKAATSVLN